MFFFVYYQNIKYQSCVE